MEPSGNVLRPLKTWTGRPQIEHIFVVLNSSTNTVGKVSRINSRVPFTGTERSPGPPEGNKAPPCAQSGGGFQPGLGSPRNWFTNSFSVLRLRQYRRKL